MDSTVIEEKGIIFETFNEEDVSVLICIYTPQSQRNSYC